MAGKVSKTFEKENDNVTSRTNDPPRVLHIIYYCSLPCKYYPFSRKAKRHFKTSRNDCRRFISQADIYLILLSSFKWL